MKRRCGRCPNRKIILTRVIEDDIEYYGKSISDLYAKLKKYTLKLKEKFDASEYYRVELSAEYNSKYHFPNKIDIDFSFPHPPEYYGGVPPKQIIISPFYIEK